ncbi:MAG: tyrosine-type recombinase/integrase [Candidatus Ozemobacteraceae bacterium]
MNFCPILSAAVDQYLAARRAVGFQLRDTEEILRDFVAFASGKADTHVCSTTVLAWIRSRNSSPLRNEVRLRTVVLLARYLHAEDERHEIPQKTFCHHSPRRRPPFLFMPAHVAALVRAARIMGPEHSLKPHIYSTLFGLLVSTGLRISEALNLRIENVTPEGLLIRNAKFGKSRLLPLHATTKQRLDDYLALRLGEAGSCPFVFVSIRGGKLHQTTVRGVFRRLVYSLGIARRDRFMGIGWSSSEAAFEPMSCRRRTILSRLPMFCTQFFKRVACSGVRVALTVLPATLRAVAICNKGRAASVDRLCDDTLGFRSG